MQEQRSLIVERKDAVLWLRLNRPQALNAVTLELIEEVDAALDAALEDPALRVVVVTGTGRAFCAGADLASARDRTRGAGDQAAHANFAFAEALGRILLKLERFPLPVIAAVNGIAAAGGLELLLCCDFVIAAESARIGDAHAKYGLIPGGGSTVRLPARVGIQLAKYLIYSGVLLPAREFLVSGLVWKVARDDELASEVTVLALELSSKSPLALRRAKHLIQQGLQTPHEQALVYERQINRDHSTSDDRKEGLKAFSEKRPPIFTGR